VGDAFTICYLRRGRPLLAVGLLLAFAALAHALIGVAFPLSAMVDESEWIAVAKVERIDRQAPLVVLSVSEDLKGKAIDRRLVIDFKGDWYAKKYDHVPQLLGRLAPNDTLTRIIDFLHWRGRFADVHGFLYDLEGYTLMQLAAHGEGTGAIVEIGSFMGRSTAFLAAGAMRTGREKVYAVDHFQGSPEHQPGQPCSHPVLQAEGTTFGVFQQNMQRLGLSEQVIPIRSLSAEAARTWQGPIRLLFIDSDHSYECVKQDFLSWSPFVVNLGHICFHDVGVCPGVTKFLQELLNDAPFLREVLSVQSLKVLQKLPALAEDSPAVRV
jgi:hypothetical protein